MIIAAVDHCRASLIVALLSQLVECYSSPPPLSQVLRGAQLIAVASADGGATAVEGSSLPPDIQVQYVQLAPVPDHTAAVQVKQHTRTHKTQTVPGSCTHVQLFATR